MSVAVLDWTRELQIGEKRNKELVAPTIMQRAIPPRCSKLDVQGIGDGRRWERWGLNCRCSNNTSPGFSGHWGFSRRVNIEVASAGAFWTLWLELKGVFGMGEVEGGGVGEREETRRSSSWSKI